MGHLDYRFLAGKAFYHKLLAFTLLFLGMYIIVPLVFLIFSIPFVGMEAFEPVTVDSNMLNINLMKALQLFTQVGIFGVSTWIFVRMQEDNVSQHLGLKRFSNIKTLLVSIALLFCSLPLVYVSMEWNQNLPFPESLSGFKESLMQQQARSEEMMEIFLNTSGIGGLLFNIFLIALIPAFFEEIFFRGALQKLFFDRIKNVHISIIIVSILFSAVHFQFFSFLPRFVLGLALGYMAFYSGSLWTAIVAHAVNNGVSVVIAWMFYNGYTSYNYHEIGETPHWTITVLALVLSVIFVVFLRKKSSSNQSLSYDKS